LTGRTPELGASFGSSAQIGEKHRCARSDRPTTSDRVLRPGLSVVKPAFLFLQPQRVVESGFDLVDARAHDRVLDCVEVGKIVDAAERKDFEEVGGRPPSDGRTGFGSARGGRNDSGTFSPTRARTQRQKPGRFNSSRLTRLGFI
jgi:hypothetical protein